MDVLTRTLIATVLPLLIAVVLFRGSYSLITLFLSISWWQILVFGVTLEAIGGTLFLKKHKRLLYVLSGGLFGFLVGGSISWLEYLDIVDVSFAYTLMIVGFILGISVAGIVLFIESCVSRRAHRSQ